MTRPAHLPVEVPRFERLFVFRLGEHLLAVDAGSVEAVDEPVSPTPVPGCPDHVLGVVSLRGRALPLLDLRRLLGLRDGADRDEDPVYRRMLVLVEGELEVCAVCDRARGLEEVSLDRLEAPGLLQGDALRRFVRAEIQEPHGVIGVLDLEALLEGARP